MFKKHLIPMFVTLSILSSGFLSFGEMDNRQFETSEIKIIMNNKSIKLDNPLIVFNGKSYLPLREAMEKLPSGKKFEMNWKPQTQQIELKAYSINKSGAKGNFENITLTLGKKKVLLNNMELSISDAPILYDGKAYIPLRPAATIMGYQVKWDKENGTIILNGG